MKFEILTTKFSELERIRRKTSELNWKIKFPFFTDHGSFKKKTQISSIEILKLAFEKYLPSSQQNFPTFFHEDDVFEKFNSSIF